MTRGGNDGCEAARRSWLETARSGGRCAHCGSRTLAPSGLERAAAFASPAGSALGSLIFFSARKRARPVYL